MAGNLVEIPSCPPSLVRYDKNDKIRMYDQNGCRDTSSPSTPGCTRGFDALVLTISMEARLTCLFHSFMLQ